MTPIEFAWEALSNTLRLYVEASVGFKSLFAIDKEEAIANHDRAFDAKLEAFHRLYDVTKPLAGFDYFAHPDTALFIHLRNALHHRDHQLFVSWNAMLFGDGGIERKAGAGYLLASYDGLSELTAKYYLPLHDFFARLSHSTIKKGAATKAMWESDLGFAAIAHLAESERYPKKQVYVDVIPIFISAMGRVATWLKAEGVVPDRFDGKVYVNHFTKLPSVDLTKPVFKRLSIPLFVHDHN